MHFVTEQQEGTETKMETCGCVQILPGPQGSAPGPLLQEAFSDNPPGQDPLSLFLFLSKTLSPSFPV